MDTSPTHGDPIMESGDWRAQLQADSRQRIVNKILDTLKRHLPFSGPEGLLELKKMAVRFEEKIYNSATSQSDYLRKISSKMITMETESQNPNSTANSLNPTDPGTNLGVLEMASSHGPGKSLKVVMNLINGVKPEVNLKGSKSKPLKPVTEITHSWNAGKSSSRLASSGLALEATSSCSKDDRKRKRALLEKNTRKKQEAKDEALLETLIGFGKTSETKSVNPDPTVPPSVLGTLDDQVPGEKDVFAEPSPLALDSTLPDSGSMPVNALSVSVVAGAKKNKTFVEFLEERKGTSGRMVRATPIVAIDQIQKSRFGCSSTVSSPIYSGPLDDVLLDLKSAVKTLEDFRSKMILEAQCRVGDDERVVVAEERYQEEASYRSELAKDLELVRKQLDDTLAEQRVTDLSHREALDKLQKELDAVKSEALAKEDEARVALERWEASKLDLEGLEADRRWLLEHGMAFVYAECKDNDAYNGVKFNMITKANVMGYNQGLVDGKKCVDSGLDVASMPLYKDLGTAQEEFKAAYGAFGKFVPDILEQVQARAADPDLKGLKDLLNVEARMFDDDDVDSGDPDTDGDS